MKLSLATEYQHTSWILFIRIFKAHNIVFLHLIYSLLALEMAKHFVIDFKWRLEANGR